LPVKELEKFTEINLSLFIDDLSYEICNDNLNKKSLDVSCTLLGGRSLYEKIKVNDGEQRQLDDNIFKQSSTSSTVPVSLWELWNF